MDEWKALEELKEQLKLLDPEDLKHIRDYADNLLKNLQPMVDVEGMERRRGDRYPLVFEGKCWYPDNPNPSLDEQISIRVVEISHNGCAFVCPHSFDAHQRLMLKIMNPNNAEQLLHVEVIRAFELKEKNKTVYKMGCMLLDDSGS